MNKFYAFVASLCLCFSVLNAQVEFEVTGGTVNAGSQTVDVDVIINNFTDVISMQFSVNWDPAVFTYNSIQNVTTELAQFTEASNMGTPTTAVGVEDGQLTVSWNLSSTDPTNLPDGTRLFTIRLSAVGNNCDESDVFISDVPRIIEFVDSDFALIDVTQTQGFISIDDGTCMGGGNMDGVGLIVEDQQAPKGSSICIPVTTKNFSNISSLQAGIVWDPTVLQFTGINDAGLTMITVNDLESDNGELRVLWIFDTEFITIPDDGTIFELCFDVIGNTGQSTTINFVNLQDFPIEIADAQAMNQDFFVDRGTFTVGSGGGSMTGVGFLADDLFTNNASTICVPVTTRNFNNIAAFQVGIGFDPAVLSFTNINDGQLSSVNVGDGQAANGELRILWSVDIGSNPETLPDDAVLFELCFDVVGSTGQSSPIGFINIPFFPIEVINGDAETEEFFIDDGSVTIGEGMNAADFSLIASDEIADEGDTVCVDISVEGFTDIQGMGFTITWDETVVDYIDERNFNLPNLGGTQNFNFIGPDKLRVIYTPTTPQTVADGTSIFQVCYRAIGNCDEGPTSAIDFISDTNSPIEIINSDTELIPFNLVSGSVTIDTCQGPITVIEIIRPTCAGDTDGAIAVDLNGFTGTTECVWTDSDGNVVSMDCNLLQVAGGSYTLTVTDENSMMATRTVELTEPLPISVIADVTNAGCNQESALSLSVSGGIAADGTYSYAWSGGLADMPSFTGIPAGTYDVTISDDNNCTLDTSFVLTDSSIITNPIVMDVTAMSGDNGSIDLNVNSTDGLTFSWSTGADTESISGLTPDTYVVTITSDDGCEKTESFDIKWGAVFGDDISDNSTGTFNGFGISCTGEADGVIDGMVVGGCADGPIVITLDGAEVTFPVSGLTAGTYELRIEDACGNVDVQSIALAAPDPITTTGPAIECSDADDNNGTADLNLIGGVGAYSISTSAGSVDANGRIVNLPEGAFTVVVEDENGCQVMFSGLEVETCVSLPCTDVATVISPNGDNVNDNFVIGCIGSPDASPNNLTVYDRWGQLVFESDNYDNSWNGTDQSGSALDEGGYMYVLSVGPPGARELFRGTVTILR